MSNKASYKRLTKEYKAIVNNPIPFIIAKPLESNILEWHYIITGPPETPYSGGQYHGKLVFPNDYPFKPPSIMMITPNGRFETNTRLCLSISDFHPDTWNPAWSVSTILNGLLSFMNSDDITTGSIKTSSEEKAKLAKLSMKYNFKNKKFIDTFPELKEKMTDAINSIENEIDTFSSDINVKQQSNIQVQQNQQQSNLMLSAQSLFNSNLKLVFILFVFSCLLYVLYK